MQDRPIIKLNDEIQFAQSYIYLMKIRYNDGLRVHTRVHPEYGEHYILPFGLQILIENAVKHNVISRKNPLCIIIETTSDGSIRVENNLQPKQGNKESNGLGLANLNERYRLMFGKRNSDTSGRFHIFSTNSADKNYGNTKRSNRILKQNESSNCRR